VAESRPIGVTIFGSVLVFLGGLASFIVLLEIFDSVNIYGIDAIAIISSNSFRGFLVFAMVPVMLYSAGLGILLLRSWARKVAVFLIPFLAVAFFMTKQNFIVWILIIAWLVYYFNQKHVKKLFV